MALHLIKLSVGAESVEDLRGWQAERKRHHGRVFHKTRMMPKRAEELLDGGSIYWVIKGLVRARQRFLEIERGHGEDGRPATFLILDSALVPTWPLPWRAFQGWRYLKPEDAPADLDRAIAEAASEVSEMPAEMLIELRQLGLL